MGKIIIFFCRRDKNDWYQRKKERKKERKIVQIYLHTFIILRTLKDERFDLNI